MSGSLRRADPALRDVVLLAIAVAGLALCITLVYEAMRTVMDVGGACADGGPYVSAQPCPDGSAGAMLLGIFGLFGFGGLGMVAGARIGGYGWVPLLAWTGLFAALGWNFIEYGLVNPPDGAGVVWGWLIPGLMFEVMAWAPVVFVIWAVRSAGGSRVASPVMASLRPNVLRGPGQPVSTLAPAPARPAPESETTPRRAELGDIDALLGAAIRSREAAAPSAETLLDRLDRLGEMLDRGQLTREEYDTAKAAVMRDLEARP